MNKIKILDCTLRDGGLGLEDAYKNNISSVGFNAEDIDRVTLFLRDSKIDIVELGSIEETEEDKTRFAIYQDVESVSKNIPKMHSMEQMYVALYRGPDTCLDDIPEWNPSLVDGVRVIIRYSELKKSMDFCAALSQKGYKVFVQPMLTMRYTDEELDFIIEETNKMNAYALYFVDSYGYMQEDDVIRFVRKYDQKLKETIKIGFHAHNNMNLAYSNVLAVIKQEIKHDLIIDSCAIGMGQGAGNLQTELITWHLNKIDKNRYDFSSILEVCEIIEKYMKQSIWGYSVTRLLPALHQTAYKYAISLRNKYGFSLATIDRILSQIPDELRHRYTAENIELILKNDDIL